MTRRLRRGAPLRTLLGAVVAAVAVTGLVAPAAEAEAPLLWGAHPNPRPGESRQDATTRLETLAARKLAAVRLFYVWDSAFPSTYENDLKAGGSTLVISVKARRTNGAAVPWSSLAAAEPGSALHADMVRWAQRVRDWGAPIYVTLNHEPEASANRDLGNAAQYIAAWQKWVSIFRAEGATNAKFMWIMTDQSFWLPTTDSRAAHRWYPGDAAVDGIAGDAYNWFTCRPGIVNAWKPLRQIIDPQRQFWLQHQSEELWLTEYGTVEDPAVPGRKAQWYRDAQALFKEPDFAAFDGVMQFESVPSATCKWSPDTSATAGTAWREWGQDAYYGGTGTPPPPTKTAALVVGNGAAPAAADAGIADRLRDRGYTVTILDDGTVNAADVTGASVVLVTQTIGQAQIGTRLRTSTRPIVLWKPSVYDEFGMTASDGNTLDGTAVQIANAGHPLAAGRSGTVTVTSATSALPRGAAGANAAVVATVGGQASLFAYGAGVAMPGLTAPACRIAVPMVSQGIPRMTADGLALFDTAVDHAAAGCP
jgi:hypothetical protein